MRSVARARGASAGYSLVEILIVVALIAILTAFGFLRVDRAGAQVDSQVQALAFAMDAAQREALFQQHDVRLIFDVDARRVVVHRDDNNDGSIQPGERQTPIQLEDGVEFGLHGSDGLPWGTDPVTFREVGGNPTLIYHRNGSASEFGAVYITSLRPETELNRAIEVERATGAVRCFRYSSGSWSLTC